MIVLRRYDLERAVTAVHRIAVSDETSVEVPLNDHLPSDFTGVWSPDQAASCQPSLVFERGHLSDNGREKWLCWVADAQVGAEELEACLRTRRGVPFMVASPDAWTPHPELMFPVEPVRWERH